MARYNREFLVPYLQNICALHMADYKLQKRYNNLGTAVNQMVHGKPIHEPVPPEKERLGCFAIGCAVMSVLSVLFLIVGITENSDVMVGGYFFMLLIFGGITAYSIFEVKRNNRIDEEDYKRALEKYQSTKKYNDGEVAKIPAYENEMKKCQQERNRIQGILQRAYSANVVPSRYRNIYAAVYLYDWFSTSRADDLDHALSMFVLEEIKERLDTIIENQSEMILNQRIMIANQHRTIEQQKSFESMMRMKLSRIQATQEEQLCYTRMIESNTAANAYFAAVNYFNKM